MSKKSTVLSVLSWLRSGTEGLDIFLSPPKLCLRHKAPNWKVQLPFPVWGKRYEYEKYQGLFFGAPLRYTFLFAPYWDKSNNTVPDAIPSLNIVIQVVGSRGDPFVALGNALQKCGHSVHIATHGVFADFVQNSGLEFFSIGRAPAELMGNVVKNQGLIPQMKSLRDGEVQKKQAMMARCGSRDFHRNLPTERMRCHVMPNQVAIWTYKRCKRDMNLSKAAVQTLIDNNKIDPKHQRGYEINKIVVENRRWDLLIGIVSATTKIRLDMLNQPAKCYTILIRTCQEPFSHTILSKKYENTTNVSTQTRTSIPPSHISSDRQDAEQGKNPLVVAGNMAGATLKGFGKFAGTYFKGVVVDIPHAAAEGFRQVYRLYGEKPKDYGEVRDWKSDGLTGIFTQSVKGARGEGALGAAKGFAKGTIGLVTKVLSAGIGLVAYPFHGITKNIEAVVRSKSCRAVVNARLIDGYLQT